MSCREMRLTHRGQVRTLPSSSVACLRPARCSPIALIDSRWESLQCTLPVAQPRSALARSQLSLSLALPHPSSPLSPFPIFVLVRSYGCLPHLCLFLPWCPNSLFLLFPYCTETFSPFLLLLPTATRSLHPRLNRPDRSAIFAKTRIARQRPSTIKYTRRPSRIWILLSPTARTLESILPSSSPSAPTTRSRDLTAATWPPPPPLAVYDRDSTSIHPRVPSATTHDASSVYSRPLHLSAISLARISIGVVMPSIPRR